MDVKRQVSDRRALGNMESKRRRENGMVRTLHNVKMTCLLKLQLGCK